ncbi:zinc metallo ase nas-4-like [Paramuricea clavata]|uniref:Zinc metallo ase nas-4-like n=1 Tax=Paramuricea clavata TaxID=317549 RepID=A0A6S7GMM8_PARCT|nr:zinc metallo ase nas-4-like [Paramuricea clavata]
MPYMIHFGVVLLLLLQISSHGQTAPVAGKQDTAKSTKTTTVTENDLLEGDMIIDKTMMNIIANQTVNTKRSAVTNGVRLWSNGVVPYIINNQLSSYAQSIIRQAIAELHASTCIKFKRRISINEFHYVEFIKGNG